MNRSIYALTGAQAVYWFAVLVSISLSSVIGAALAPSSSLATLPYALISLSALLATFYLSRLVAGFGWRRVLGGGAIAGVGAAVLSIVAILRSDFALFCVACLFMGVYQASAAYYRLAAIALAPHGSKGAAIGWVLSGSLIAAFLGPTLATLASDWFGASIYAGPYLLSALLSSLAIPALALLPPLPKTGAIARQPAAIAPGYRQHREYRLGTFNTAFAQSVMILMMVIAPLSMHQSGCFEVHHGVSVIGWHIVGMFLPSYFSGRLLDRVPANRVVYAGLAMLAGSALAAMLGQSLSDYYISLFLLGTGWNFVYMAGTWQYNSALTEADRSHAQGRSEFIIALSALVAAASGSALLVHFSWAQINTALLLALAAAALWNAFYSRPPAKGGEPVT